jgi:hypothetical protein
MLKFRLFRPFPLSHSQHVALSSLIVNMGRNNKPLFVQQLRFLFFVFCPYLNLYNSYYSKRADSVA